MDSVKSNRPAQYRARAEQARQQAALATNEAARKVLLNDASLWERMAEYEEKNIPQA
jgi:hypothetical protein